MSTLESRQKIVYWRGIIRKFNDSKLSANEFSKKNNISANKLSYWKLRIKRLDSNGPFIEIEEKSPAAAEQKNDITLSINDVITINFTTPPSPEWLSELLSSVKRVA